MWQVVIADDGSIRLPAEALDGLQWPAGTRLTVERRGSTLVLTAQPPGSPPPPDDAPTLKDRARQLADAMRNLGETREVQSMLASIGLSSREAPAATAPTSANPPAAPAPAAAPAAGKSPGPLRDLDGIAPTVPESAYVAEDAVIIGDVVLGDECSVWPNAVIRGDVNRIRIGARTNVQDGAVVHADAGEFATMIGAGVTIGHGAVVHGCTLGDDVLVGIHAVVLNGAKIGPKSIVGAGAVVAPGTEIPSGKLALGVPARVVRDLTPEDVQSILRHADAYMGLRRRYHPDAPAAPDPPREPDLPVYRVRRARAPIEVDGALDEPAWADTSPFPAFRRAEDGAPPRFPTELRLCWDERFLYAAFSCKDTDIRGTLTEHDAPLYNEEVVELFLCPSGDLRHYFELEISPRNVLFDAKVFSPEQDRRSMLVQPEWHAPGIRTAVRVAGTIEDSSDVDVGWIVEAAIPFADLGLPGPPAPGTRWRANFYRIERGEVLEFTCWSPTLKDPADFHVPSRFGTLEFISD